MYETLIWEETFPGCSLNEHNWNRRVGKQRAAILHATQSGGQRRHLKNHRPSRGGTRTVWDPLSIYLSPNRYPWEIFLSVREGRIPRQMFCGKRALAGSLDAAGG